MQDTSTISPPSQAMTNASDGCSPESRLCWPSESQQPGAPSDNLYESRVLKTTQQSDATVNKMSTDNFAPILGSEQADNKIFVYHSTTAEPDAEMMATDGIAGSENATKVLTQPLEIVQDACTQKITSDQQSAQSLVSQDRASHSTTTCESHQENGSQRSFQASRLMNVYQAALFNDKLLPFGIKLKLESAITSSESDCDGAEYTEETKCKKSSDTKTSNKSSGDSGFYIRPPTSRQLSIAENKKQTTVKTIQQRFDCGAATRAGFKGDPSIKKTSSSAKTAQNKTSKPSQGAKNKLVDQKVKDTISQQASHENSVAPQDQSRTKEILADKPVRKLDADQSISQSIYLKCQMLIHRIYAEAYGLDCRKDEIFAILVDFSANNFLTKSQLTQSIINATFPATDDAKCTRLFEYVNEQMIKLGLDVDSEDIELFPSKRSVMTASLAESEPSEEATDKQIVSQSPKKVNQAEKAIDQVHHDVPQQQINQDRVQNLLDAGSSKVVSKVNSTRQSTSKKAQTKALKQATLSANLQVVKPQGPQLSEEETRFIQTWISRLTLVQQAGVAEIVTKAGCGKISPEGEFDFDLAELPYKVAMGIHKYVSWEARYMIRAERHRDNILRKQAQKATEKAEKEAEREVLKETMRAEKISARASKARKSLTRASTSDQVINNLEDKDIVDGDDVEVDDPKTQELKQVQAQLCQSLSDAPIANVSDLMQKVPDLPLSEDIQEKVFSYREDLERQIMLTQEVSGDQTQARHRLIQKLSGGSRSKEKSAASSSSEESSSSSSDSEERRDEDQTDSKILGKRKRLDQQQGADLTALWADTQSDKKRAKLAIEK